MMDDSLILSELIIHYWLDVTPRPDCVFPYSSLRTHLDFFLYYIPNYNRTQHTKTSYTQHRLVLYQPRPSSHDKR